MYKCEGVKSMINKINELKKEINKHNKLYYIDDAPM